MNRPFSDQMLLSFSIVLFVGSYFSYFLAMIPATQGDGIQTGGWLGIARALASLKSLSMVPALLYLWRVKSRRWLTHPVILTMLLWATVIGIFNTTKQDAMEPFVFYILVGFLRYGWQEVRLWSLATVGLIFFAVIVFPYSQYVRHAGGREGSFQHRAEVTQEVFWKMTTDRDFRSTITARVTKEKSYFDQPSLAPFGRLAMVGEADRLISATEQGQGFTGWETITWGFKLLTPSFINPDKPVFEAGNFLGHIGGEVGSSDYTTQISYGVMANLYNAFSFMGVLVGTPLFFAGFYYVIRMFMGNPLWEGLPTTSTLWFIWLIAIFQHNIVESSLAGVIASLGFPIVLALLYISARTLCMVLPREEMAV
jgi:hypothetical protein